MNEKKLYLIDGYAFIYRAYYALARTPLVNSKGFPTGAIYGFVNQLLRLIETYDCQYAAVIMDSATKTFRHEMYPQYKANRSAMPDELKTQIPRIYELLDALNIPVIKRDGFEADDIIASITRKAANDGYEVFLVTKDKDLMQLIGNNVRMLAPNGANEFNVIGVNDVKEKMGVMPEQILDYLSLVGDSSDNIPGVPGIGPKSAAKILESATVDAILEDARNVNNPKLISKFEEYKEQLAISKKLATLRFDAYTDFDMETLKRKNVDALRSQTLFKELEFFSFLKNPLFLTQGKVETTQNIIDNANDLRALITMIKDNGHCAIDASTSEHAVRIAKITAVAISVDSKTGYLIDLSKNSCRDELINILRKIIEDENIGKTGYNFKHLMQAFKGAGLTLRGMTFDVMLAAYLIDPGKRNNELAALANMYLGQEMTTNECGAETVCAMLQLAKKLKQTLAEKNCESLYNDIELPLVPVLANLEWTGVLIDTDLLSRMSSEYSAELSQLTNHIYALADCEFNINSPKQLGEILFNKLGLHGGKKTKGGAQSTNAEVLENLADEHIIVKEILNYREKQKLLSTYIDALPAQILQETKRIHTTFNQAVTSTGRLSSANPNLQNIPVRTDHGRKIREAFIAPDGYTLVSADYSQIELRILAHLSNDPTLVQAFIDDMDIHTQTASTIYGIFSQMVTPEMRRAAKTINFGLMYGMGPVNLAKQLGVSFAEAKRFIEAYFEKFSSVRNYLDTSIQSARDLGYAQTLLGRRRYLPEINSTNRVVREGAERMAINTPVQGTAADIIKLAMINVHAKLKEWSQTKMLLQVHDELVFETPQDTAQDFAKWVADVMSAAYKLKVPLKVDVGIGRHWDEAH